MRAKKLRCSGKRAIIAIPMSKVTTPNNSLLENCSLKNKIENTKEKTGVNPPIRTKVREASPRLKASYKDHKAKAKIIPDKILIKNQKNPGQSKNQGAPKNKMLPNKQTTKA